MRNLTICALLTFSLAGCANLPAVGPQGTPGLAVNLSALKVCEQVLDPMPATTSSALAVKLYPIARGEIDDGRNCVADVRARYSKKKK